MADKENNTNFEEEDFDFEHNEHEAEAAPVLAPPKKKNTSVFIVGGIVSVLVIWQGMNHFGKKSSTTSHKEVASLKITKPEKTGSIDTTALPEPPAFTDSLSPTTMAVAPSAPISMNQQNQADLIQQMQAPSSSPAVTMSAVEPLQVTELKSGIERLENQNREQEQHLKFLEQALRHLNTQFGQLNQVLDQQNNDLSGIQVLLQKTVKEINNLANTPRPESSNVNRSVATNASASSSTTNTSNATVVKEDKAPGIDPELITAPRLSVHAIIPGRAWLKSKDGRTLTVIEGEDIPPYGTVLLIDPKAGVVITSSGVALR